MVERERKKVMERERKGDERERSRSRRLASRTDSRRGGSQVLGEKATPLYLPFSCCTLSFRDQDAARGIKYSPLPHTNLLTPSSLHKQTAQEGQKEEEEVARERAGRVATS